MSDEEKVNTETTEVRQSGIPRPGRRVWPVIMSIIVVIGVVVLVGFLHWHEEPTFCSTVCHSTMQTYIDGYYSEDPALEVTAHADADVTCLGCHWSQAKMLDLVNEVILYATDSYESPLPDKGEEFINDEFCGACHDGETAPTKEETTADWAQDPHNIPDGVSMHETVSMECYDCHSMHNASTMVCAECHDDVTVPDGWQVTVNETKASTAETYGFYDPHSTIYYGFSTFHETAGSDGGTITCADCHDTQTIACAQCHLVVFENDLPEGWSVPEGAATISSALYDNGEEETTDTDTTDTDTTGTDTTDDSGTATTSSDTLTGADVADGTYTGTGTGRNGKFDVTVTVENGQITAVEVGDNQETQGIGSNAIATLPDEIIANNGTEGVDNYAGATLTSMAIKTAVNEALAQGAK